MTEHEQAVANFIVEQARNGYNGERLVIKAAARAAGCWTTEIDGLEAGARMLAERGWTWSDVLEVNS